MSVKETRNMAMTALSEQRGDTFAEWKEKWNLDIMPHKKLNIIINRPFSINTDIFSAPLYKL